MVLISQPREGKEQMTANKVATSGSIKNTIWMFSLPFVTRELGDMAVIRLRIIYSDSLTNNNNPFENLLHLGGNFQIFSTFYSIQSDRYICKKKSLDFHSIKIAS